MSELAIGELSPTDIALERIEADKADFDTRRAYSSLLGAYEQEQKFEDDRARLEALEQGVKTAVEWLTKAKAAKKIDEEMLEELEHILSEFD